MSAHGGHLHGSHRRPLTLRRLALGALIALAMTDSEDLDAQSALLRAADVDRLPAKPATARIAYGTEPEQFGDLRVPDGPGPFPVAVVVHGGCWVMRYASITNSTALADALRDAGVATWNIEYRRADSPGGGWPNTFLDAAAATDHLREVAKTYPLDLSRVITIGHSAGGHLAMWLAGAKRIPPSSPLARRDPLPLRGVVTLAGIADLADFRTYQQNTCGDVVDGLMGGDATQRPDRYAAGSPVALFPLGVPQVQIVGTLDRVMPQRAREAHASAARASGDPFELIVVDGAGHHEVMSPRSAVWRHIEAAVKRLLAPR